MIERRFCHHDPVEYEYEYRCTEHEYDCPDEPQNNASTSESVTARDGSSRSWQQTNQRTTEWSATLAERATTSSDCSPSGWAIVVDHSVVQRRTAKQRLNQRIANRTRRKLAQLAANPPADHGVVRDFGPTCDNIKRLFAKRVGHCRGPLRGPTPSRQTTPLPANRRPRAIGDRAANQPADHGVVRDFGPACDNIERLLAKRIGHCRGPLRGPTPSRKTTPPIANQQPHATEARAVGSTNQRTTEWSATLAERATTSSGCSPSGWAIVVDQRRTAKQRLPQRIANRTRRNLAQQTHQRTTEWSATLAERATTSSSCSPSGWAIVVDHSVVQRRTAQTTPPPANR